MGRLRTDWIAPRYSAHRLLCLIIRREWKGFIYILSQVQLSYCLHRPHLRLVREACAFSRPITYSNVTSTQDSGRYHATAQELNERDRESSGSNADGKLPSATATENEVPTDEMAQMKGMRQLLVNSEC